ncbi:MULTISPECIES: nicotinate (nicotinamide) nucleotide adenylyltransferase [unclassified Undibacterium]|uniref:nicotinate (nicotinamide) nucleotide adenylyltransferase n=1 Tax=unclassified Undibacterium TaxID=2630295 RepID=UPI002AC9D050|nr:MULTISPECIES: nicotinate (nicotinamide) nucleotide adenylyltransferase [unclassified Undibacterium]MEB0141100.1 nicotinate (nicotinamide) nucleotide adenylyltransferase [Undibacterium sp. CCC2.1]MEB0174129.1 nicotinate (nicotinamide) nucleotide adenylyltransferase [Undibacterium sp. CCC1.1]MEB0177828.1 nicotinate (nicotinamide) nucleotide adenylyltransferase [Undibacterium sp. CCC3.4]MEB0217035.1 nicotinate (nicotinamide) nucleotide adenylyltransferase [Undibacterium sp. 5I2]WPX41995.1 nico
MGVRTEQPPCILLLGGSFDPVHLGHVALAKSLCDLLHPDQLRLIPAGQPWQKSALTATAAQRVAMLELAFADWRGGEVYIDQQEIRRAERLEVSYTIDTLQELRQQFGPAASLNLAMGADQLLNLSTWWRWRELFTLANLCVAARPGYSLQALPPEIAEEWQKRTISAQAMRTRAAGGVCLEPNLAMNVSASQLRTELTQHNPTIRLLVPHKVLDYLQLHSIY